MWISWNLKALAYQVLVQQLIQVNNIVSIKAPHYWPFVSGIHQCIPLTEWPFIEILFSCCVIFKQKKLHLKMSSASCWPLNVGLNMLTAELQFRGAGRVSLVARASNMTKPSICCSSGKVKMRKMCFCIINKTINVMTGRTETVDIRE